MKLTPGHNHILNQSDNGVIAGRFSMTAEENTEFIPPPMGKKD
jgi:hypothetical protein